EARRLSDLGATMVGVLSQESIDHYAVAMKDPRATNSTSTDGSHSRRDVLTKRPGEDAEPSPKPRKALDPQVLTIAPSAPVTTQGGGGGSGCHRRRVVSAGGSPRLSALPPEVGWSAPAFPGVSCWILVPLELEGEWHGTARLPAGVPPQGPGLGRG